MSDNLIAWSYGRPTAKAIGVFDRDDDAMKCKAHTEKVLNHPSSGKKAFTTGLIPGSELKQCYCNRISVPFGPEELLPKDIWDYAEQKGWLEDRLDPLSLYRFDRRDITFDTHLKVFSPITIFSE